MDKNTDRTPKPAKRGEAALKPCPFCGGEFLKHYVTATSGGGARGVVVCKSCGARLEAYNDDYRYMCEVGYSRDYAIIYQRGLALDAVAKKWNKRPELSCALTERGRR